MRWNYKHSETLSNKTYSNKNCPNKKYLDENYSSKFYSLLAFSLITTALLIAASIYCYLIKYCVKQKHLLSYHDTSKLKDIDIKNIL